MKLPFYLRFTPLLVYFLAHSLAYAQQKPEKAIMYAKNTSANIKIDGKLNEAEWQDGFIDSNFTQTEPAAGKPSALKTAVKVIYDNNAVYIAARLFDTSGDSVLHELTPRDNIGNTDWFGVFIDSYKDGINGVGFICSAGSVQSDFKYSVLGEDVSWNTVWQSNANIDSLGWTLEMRIPYSALRFPQHAEQQWHINFIRYTRRTREKASWSYVDPSINGFFNQAGLLSGIKDIKPPLRLQVFPYMSAYYNRYGSENASAFNGGMDVKYGINDAFTLDMTLIPDFGQVQSDNNVLNLSPVEVRFQENRQFFTEGIELFNKGDLFYSRRIGQRPIGYNRAYDNLKAGETVSKNPEETRLYNATKISGRTSNGLGLGVFNAVSRATYATIQDSTGKQREVLTSPVSNYSVLVVDQNLRNNSYITLINTNVLRNGDFYDANVNGLQFKINNKNMSYAIGGGGAYSQQLGKNGTNTTGFAQDLNLAKISGNLTWNASYNIKSNTYNPNDLGYLGLNNSIDKNFNINYNTYKPIGWFNRIGSSFFLTHSTIYVPREFANFGLGVENYYITRSFQSFGGWANWEPITTYDYYEPRAVGRFYTYPINYTLGGWISTDYRRRLALDLSGNYRRFNEYERYYSEYNIAPRFRVNNKLSFIYSYTYQWQNNDVGYAVFNDYGYSDGNFPDGELIFGIRNRYTHTNVFTAKYSFNAKSGLNLRLRQYWSGVTYKSFHNLDKNGFLQTTSYTGSNSQDRTYHNDSYNAFNIDLVYSWVFTPGSQLSVVWKQSIYSSENQTNRTFTDNLSRTLQQNQTNSFSIRLLYFFDYQYLMKRKA